MSRTEVRDWVEELIPLSRRRRGGEALSEAETERFEELVDALGWELGQRPPLGVDERDLRVPSSLKLRFDEREAQLGNVSNGGLCVEVDEPPVPGTTLSVELDPGDGGSPLEVEVVVAWRREFPNFDGAAGFGGPFRSLDPEESERVFALVERELRARLDDLGI